MVSVRGKLVVLAVFLLILAVPAQADLLGDFINLLTGNGSPVESQANGNGGFQLNEPYGKALADRNYIGIYPDIIGTQPNQQLNLSWNFTTWDISKFPDCYIRIYGDMHTCPQDWPFATCPLEFKINDPFQLEKKIDGRKVRIPERLQTGATYYINLQCEVLGGINNQTVPYESINLDIVAFSTKTGFNRIIDTDYCTKLPGTNCTIWRQEVSDGQSWSKNVLGVM